MRSVINDLRREFTHATEPHKIEAIAFNLASGNVYLYEVSKKRILLVPKSDLCVADNSWLKEKEEVIQQYGKPLSQLIILVVRGAATKLD